MVTIPTLQQLQSDILADLQTQYGGTSIPLFGRVFLRALAWVQAGKIYLLYLAVANVQKNVAPDTADAEANGGTLERFGRLYLNRNPFPATAGQYTVQVTGSIGATIPENTTFKTDDSAANPGYLFILDAAYTLTATTDTITLRALTPGTESRMQVSGTSDTLSVTSPIAGVDRQATATAETVQPLDAETLEDYRSKILDAIRLEANGGSATDYRLWAADAQGVKTVYPYAKSGAANEIDVYVEATVADSTDGYGTPSSTILNDVASVIEFSPDTTRPLNERGRRPLGVFDVHCLPITPLAVDVNIAGYVGLTAAIQTDITNALTELINSVRPFVAGADIIDAKNDVLDTNRIIAAILGVRPGSTFGAITLTVGGAPVSTYTFVLGNIPYVNQITFS